MAYFVPLPDTDYLKSILAYMPDGQIFWLSNGEIAGNSQGRIKIDGKSYALNRIIWKMNNYDEPKGAVKYISEDKTDNRIENLYVNESYFEGFLTPEILWETIHTKYKIINGEVFKDIDGELVEIYGGSQSMLGLVLSEEKLKYILSK